jgi:hypothetical protein
MLERCGSILSKLELKGLTERRQAAVMHSFAVHLN